VLQQALPHPLRSIHPPAHPAVDARPVPHAQETSAATAGACAAEPLVTDNAGRAAASNNTAAAVAPAAGEPAAPAPGAPAPARKRTKASDLDPAEVEAKVGWFKLSAKMFLHQNQFHRSCSKAAHSARCSGHHGGANKPCSWMQTPGMGNTGLTLTMSRS
jgi:hypothetical protein